MSTATVENTNVDNESIVKRAPIADGWVELNTLRPGDIFYNDFCRGKVVHRASNGNMVEVLFDGHTVAQSVAPSLRVKHGGGLVLPEELRPTVADVAPVVVADKNRDIAPVIQRPALSPGYVAPAVLKPVAIVKTIAPVVAPVVPVAVPAPVVTPAAPVVASPVVTPAQATAIVQATQAKDSAILAEHNNTTVAAAPTATGAPRIMRLAIPVSQAPVMAAPVARATRTTSASTTAPDMTSEQIAALPQALRKSVGALISHALLNGWTKANTFAACKAFFPSLRAGQNFKSCVDQCNLYRMNLRRAGKLA